MNRRKLTALSTLVSGAAAAALLAGTLTNGAPAAFASQLATIGGATITGVQVQNLSSSAATISMMLYPQAGGNPITLSPKAPQPAQTPAEGSANFYLPSESSVPSGAYGAVLSADQQIAAIARTEWRDSGKAGAAIYGTVPPAQNVVLPLVAGPTAASPAGYYNQVSEFTVQNAADANTNSTVVTIDLYRVGDANVVRSMQYTVAAGTSKSVRMGQGDFSGLPDAVGLRGFLGYAKISSNSASNPLVVQSFVDFTNSSKAVYAFSGVPQSSAATTLFAPLVRRDYYGTTGISLVNTGGTDANVKITYFNDPNSPAKISAPNDVENVVVKANGSLVVYQGATATTNPLPTKWFGSAKIESDQPILGVINDALLNGSTIVTSAAYNAPTASDGGLKVFAPLVRRNHTPDKLTTGIQVQNIGSGPADITVKYTTSAGATSQETATGVAQFASKNFYQGSGTAFPSGAYGSATIESNQPIVLIVNDASATGTLDAALYNGLK